MAPDSVSVVIPAHNCERFIDQALESCFRQTVPPREIIVIDDGSTDGTAAMLKRHADLGRIRYAYQDPGERSAARNRGLDMAGGSLVQFLDADDVLHPRKLERQLDYLRRNPGMDGVYSATAYFRDSVDRPVGFLRLGYQGNILGRLLARNHIPINAMLFRKSTQRFDVSLNALEDWDYWLRLCLSGYRIGHLPEILSYVRVHGTNSSRSIQRTLRTELGVLERYRGLREYRPVIAYRRISLEFLLRERGVLDGLWKTLLLPGTGLIPRTKNVLRFLKMSVVRNRRNIYRAGRRLRG